MRFERRQDPRRAMSIGEKPKEIFRLLEWRGNGPHSSEPGLYIVQPHKVPEILEMICNGELKVGHYVVEFLGGRTQEMGFHEEQLYKSRGKYVKYNQKLYLIPPGK